jgi:hypothetical protein
MSKIIDKVTYIIADLFIEQLNTNNLDYIETFIDNNLNNQIIIETISNQLLNNNVSENEIIIKNEYQYTIYKAIQLYKEHFNYNELINLLDNNDEDDTNKNEKYFYVKLALGIIYDDIINNYNLKEDILEVIIRHFEDEDENEDI